VADIEQIPVLARRRRQGNEARGPADAGRSTSAARQRPAKAQPTPEAPPAPAFDVDAFRRRRREHELAARLEELGRRNQALFMEQQRPFMAGNYLPKDADWRG
jgi:hypothetical protein